MHWESLALPLAVFAAITAAGYVARRLLFAKLRTWARTSPTRFDESILEALHGPMLLWVVMLGIHAATRFSTLPAKAADWSNLVLMVLTFVSLTIAISRLMGRAVRHFGASRAGTPQMGTLAQVMVSILVGLIGALMLLKRLEIDITPILTALGVGGLAVQDTLSNLFAGFYISITGQIRMGDLIQIETGQLGYVSDIGWRSTTLRQRNNNLIVIPNNKLGQSTVINYHLPERRMLYTMQVGVAWDSDPKRIERVLLDILHTTEVEGLLQTPPPVVLLMPGFGDRGLEYTLVFHIADYEDQFRVQHEIRSRILERFRQEGITIPFTMKTVELTHPPQ
jgi:small-conductance mechanosensitive channel